MCSWVFLSCDVHLVSSTETVLLSGLHVSSLRSVLCVAQPFPLVFSLRPQKGPLALFYQMSEFSRDPRLIQIVSGFSSNWSVKIKEL